MSQPSHVVSGKSHLGILMMLAWPAILEQLLLTLVRYVDTAMVGSLGANATAAVAINASPTWLISSILSAIGVGYSVQVAHSIGAKDKQATARIVRQALLAVLFMGISIMLICLLIAPHLPMWMGAQPDVLPDAVRYLQIYVLSLPFQCGSYTFSAVLRCMGDTKTPLILNTAANLLNVVLNFFLIFPTRPTELFGMSFTVPGAGWGVAGAAIATTISTAITGLGISYTALFRKPDCRISLHDSFKPDREIIHRALELGVPTALEHTTVSAGQIVVTRINATLGTVALAADHVAVTAEGLSYMPADGISYAATALVGQSYGAQEFEDAHRFGKLSGLTGLAFSTVMGIMLFIFATPLASIFSSDPAVIELAAQMLRIVAIAEPLFGVAIVMSGALRGLGDTRFPLVISLIGMWGVRCVLAPTLVFGFKMGLAGSWIAMVCDLCVRGLLCALRFKRFTPQYLAENHR